jgi:hypothetical protein
LDLRRRLSYPQTSDESGDSIADADERFATPAIASDARRATIAFLSGAIVRAVGAPAMPMAATTE